MKSYTPMELLVQPEFAVVYSRAQCMARVILVNMQRTAIAKILDNITFIFSNSFFPTLPCDVLPI
jgi:hypothetical protein